MIPVVLVTEAGDAGGGLAEAASFAVAVARSSERGVLIVELTSEQRRRRPTLLASDQARDLEQAVQAARPDARAVARGSICWLTKRTGDEGEPLGELEELLATPLPSSLAVVNLPPALWAQAIDRSGLRILGGLVRADLGSDRELVALAVAELRSRGLAARVAKRAQGPVAARRSLAGLEAGGAASARARRAAGVLVPGLAPPEPQRELVDALGELGR